MQFYQVIGYIKEENKNKNESSAAVKGNSRVARAYAEKTDTFRQTMETEGFLFLTEMEDDHAKICVIIRNPRVLQTKLTEYIKLLDLPLEELQIQEITLSTTISLLHTAQRRHFVNDSDIIMNEFELDKLSGPFCGVNFEETIPAERTKKALYAAAKKLPIRESLCGEMDRIFKRKQARFLGHPVHYMIEGDDTFLNEMTCGLLIGALYDAGRLSSRRYSFVDLEAGDNLHEIPFENLYRNNSGGTIVIRYRGNENEETDLANESREKIEIFGKMLKKFRNDVLTIYVLPRECTQCRGIFYEQLGCIGLVELREEFMMEEDAAKRLKELAKEKGVKADETLFGSLSPEKKYLSPDLKEIFDGWFDEKLRKEFFPQYSAHKSMRCEIGKEKPKGNAYTKLMNMPGLGAAKKVMQQALDYYKAAKTFAELGMQRDSIAMHMAFSGNPGTAKTTAARLFAEIMKDNGLLSKGTFVEVGRGDLVGKYVGHTAPNIKKCFERAKGGVLFIDEAYSLVDDRSGSFGDEAINTIVQEMENHRDEVTVIFAGYPDKMEKFLQKNPGLRSRIAFHVNFEDYEPETMFDIAVHMAAEKGLEFGDDVPDRLKSIFSEAVKVSDFGNGRYVRNVLERAKMAQATRLLSGDVSQVSREDVKTLLAEDFELPKAVEGISHEVQIGFC